MADSGTPDEAAAAQRAAEQARLRKERREAKLKAGGSARLNKITGMGGRVTGDNEPPPVPKPAAAAPEAPSPPPPTQHADPEPEEVDISQHFYSPRTAQRDNPAAEAPDPGLSEAQLRQMMLGFERGAAPGPPPNPGAGPAAGMEQDPLMQMMTQMMGGVPAGAPGSSPFPGMPSMPGMPQPQQQQQAAPDASTSLWRLLHALVALGLGAYIAALTPFTGTKVEREREALGAAADPLADEMERHKRVFFWVFATAEVLLLSTRFLLLDKGRGPQGGGLLGAVVGFLPEPFRGYVAVLLRYGQIFGTVRADILACMFVLGVCSWWRV